MALLISGALLVAFGLFSGLVLLVGPLGIAPWSPGIALWVLFPLFTLVGYALLVVGAKKTNIHRLSLVVSYLLLLLSVLSGAALVFAAASVIHPIGSTLSVWYVLVVAGLFGAIGAASHGSAAPDS